MEDLGYGTDITLVRYQYINPKLASSTDCINLCDAALILKSSAFPRLILCLRCQQKTSRILPRSGMEHALSSEVINYTIDVPG